MMLLACALSNEDAPAARMMTGDQNAFSILF
jgi:hypothetical protein